MIDDEDLKKAVQTVNSAPPERRGAAIAALLVTFAEDLSGDNRELAIVQVPDAMIAVGFTATARHAIMALPKLIAEAKKHAAELELAATVPKDVH